MTTGHCVRLGLAASALAVLAPVLARAQAAGQDKAIWLLYRPVLGRDAKDPEMQLFKGLRRGMSCEQARAAVQTQAPCITTSDGGTILMVPELSGALIKTAMVNFDKDGGLSSGQFVVAPQVPAETFQATASSMMNEKWGAYSPGAKDPTQRVWKFPRGAALLAMTKDGPRIVYMPPPGPPAAAGAAAPAPAGAPAAAGAAAPTGAVSDVVGTWALDVAHTKSMRDGNTAGALKTVTFLPDGTWRAAMVFKGVWKRKGGGIVVTYDPAGHRVDEPALMSGAYLKFPSPAEAKQFAYLKKTN
jgi:hypothetical protein